MERTYASIKNAWRLLLACALCLPLLGKAQTTIHVPADHATIAAAITAASAGDTIEVGPGNYAGPLTINKALTLRGNQKGVDPRPGGSRTISSGTETIVDAAKSQTVVVIQANNVVIDGFQFQQTTGSGSATCINGTTHYAGTIFKNNIITNMGGGVALRLYGGTGARIEKNYLKNVIGDGIVLRNGNNQAIPATDQKILDNYLENVNGVGGAIYIYGQTDTEVARNIVTARYVGLGIGTNTAQTYYNLENIRVHHNDVQVNLEPASGLGIAVGCYSRNVAIYNNRVTSAGTHTGASYALVGVGSNSEPLGTQFNAENISITNNYFERSNTPNEPYLRVASHITNAVDASCNWWGTADPAQVTGKVSGSAQVHTPFLMAGSDVDAGATGFIPQPASCGSGIVHNTTQDKYYSTLNSAINDSDPNDNIEIAAGTTSISALTNVNHKLTIKGAGVASTTVQLAHTWFNSDGLLALQLNANGISIEDIHFQITGKGAGNILGLLASNLLIKNNKFSGQYVLGDGEVTRATVWGGSITGITFENNIIESLRQPGYVNGGSGTIKNNSISNTRGWVIAGAGNLAITNNVFGTNATHIAIIAGAGNLAGLSVHDNNFSGAATPAIHNQDAGNGTINVSCNWWGTTVANDIASRLSGPGAVTYAPYFVSGAEEAGQGATLGFQPIQPNTCSGTPVTITASYLPITCYGGTTNVTLTVADGEPNYIMDPNNPAVAGVSAGTYTYKVTDALGSHASVTVVIGQPNALTGTLVLTHPNCFGSSNGSIVVNANGGSGSYHYSKDDGATWPDNSTFTGLAQGTYQVRIRDAADLTCTMDLDGPVGTLLNQPAVLSATATPTSANCFGSATGSILVNAPQGGSGSYEYSVNGTNWYAGPAYSFTGLLADNYTVQVRDAAAPACLVSLPSTTVGEQPQMDATLASTNVTCNGASNGTITVSAPTGGSGSTYNVSIDGGGWVTNPTFPYTFTGLAHGAHTVAIQDGSVLSCARTVGSITITQPAVLGAGTTHTAILCNGGSSSVTLTVTGGTSPYEVSVNGGAFAALASPYSLPAANTHTFAIKDANNCTTSTSRTITQPTAIVFTATAPRIACPGGTTNVTLNITGGTTPISFSGSNPPVNTRLAGTYVYNATDFNHCPASVSITITDPTALSATLGQTNVTCNAANDGTITVSAPAGGYNTYQYSINGGSTWLPDLGAVGVVHTFPGLAPGTYTVQMRDKDAPGCSVSLGSRTITQEGALTVTATSTNATCSNTHNGTITAIGAGGYGTYEYSIDGSSWQPNGTFTSVANGPYTVSVRDAAHHNCSTTGSTVVGITPHSGNDWFVDDDNAASHSNDALNTGAVGCPFRSIQVAVDAAASTNIIHVAAGTYNEDVAVNKTLSVLGAGMGSSTVSGPIGGSGSTFQVQAQNVVIDGFTITRAGNNTTDWNNVALNSAGVAVQGMTVTAIVRNCEITGMRTGIDINNSNGNQVRNNNIHNNHTGMIFRNQTDNTAVENNFIRNNRTVGVLFLDASAGTNVPLQSAANSTFNNNDISGNWYGQIVDRQAGGSLLPVGTNTKNFRCNWYGPGSPVLSSANSTEPGYASLIPAVFGGTATAPAPGAQILGPGSANFIFSPWLADGSDEDNSTLTGFEPGGPCMDGPVKVYDTANELVHSYPTIQNAIDAPSTMPGYVVKVDAGTYAENVTVSKGITLEGANAGATCDARSTESTIQPASGLPVKILADGVTINGFEITAPNYQFGIQSGERSGLSIRSNKIHHINSSAGIALHSQGILYELDNLPGDASNVSITGNCISDIGSIAISGYSAAGIAIQGTGSTSELSELSIENNTISNVVAKASDWTTGGRIAYGIQVNVGGSNSYFTSSGNVRNAMIRANVIGPLSGHIATGIGLEGNTEEADVLGNTISALTSTKVADLANGGVEANGLKFEKNKYASTVTVTNNLFMVNSFVSGAGSGKGYGVANYVPVANGGSPNVSCNFYDATSHDEIKANGINGRILDKENCVSILNTWMLTATNIDCDGSPVVVTLDSKTDVTCIGGNNGAINVVVSGGTFPDDLIFAWTGPDTFTNTNEDITGLTSGTYELTVTDGNGSIGTLTVLIGTTTPNAAITSVIGDSPVCIGTTNPFNTTGVVLGGGAGSWSSSAPSVATVDADGEVTALTAGSADIIYTITGGCNGTPSAQQTIVVTPNAAITSVIGDSPVCIGTTNTFNTTGVVLGGGAGSWSSSAPSVATVDADGEVTALTAGSADIIYTITGGCNGTPTAQQTIVVTPNAAITSVIGDSPVCIGTTNTFNTTGVVLGGGAGSWSSSAPSVATVDAGGEVTALTAGSADIIYTITGGCNGTPSAQQTIVVTPNAAITSVIGDSPVCIGTTNTFNTTGVVLGGGAGSWSSSAPSVATVDAGGEVTALTAGSADIIYTITGGCNGTPSAQQTIVVTPNAAITSVIGDSPVCIGTTNTFNTTGVVLGGGAGTWSSSAPSVATVDADGEVTAVSAGTANIIYTITGGCNGTPTAQQTIVVTPNAAITSVIGDSPVCIGSTNTFNTTGVVLGGGAGTWSSSAPSVATVDADGVVTAVNAGTANIIYTITGGCNGTPTAQQTIVVTPNAAITSVIGDSPVCIGSTNTFNTTGVVLGGGAGSWSSSAPSVATVDAGGEVTALTAGSADIIYTITGGCNGTPSAQRTIQVDAKPVVDAGTGGADCGNGVFTLNASTDIGNGMWSQLSGPAASFAPANSPTSSVTVTGNGMVTFRWTVINGTCSTSDEVSFAVTIQNSGCDDGNPNTTNDEYNASCTCVGTPFVSLNAKALLQGPFDGTSLMSDNLRASSLIPSAQPYTAAPFNYAGGETIPGGVLAVTGNDAIVDWVLLELRAKNAPSTIVARRAALLQRDGDIVDLNGTGSVEFIGIATGKYHVAVRHRNHLGVMTSDSIALGGVPLSVDFTKTTTALYHTSGTEASAPDMEKATKVQGSTLRLLWSGNANPAGGYDRLRYLGAANDRDAILLKIGGVDMQAQWSGYATEDCNMDGVVRYNGGGNDRDGFLLVNIGGGTVTNQRIQQLP